MFLPRLDQFLCILVIFFLNFQPSLSSHLCSHHEATALIRFKKSFSNDEYDHTLSCYESYPKTNSWKEGIDCCSWDGITCDHVNSHVIGLDLSCSRLYGSFAPNSSLFDLPHLRKLNLAYNNFQYSNMPSGFGRFMSLVHLNLSYAGFYGEVPSQIFHLSKLVSLDLSDNFLHMLSLEGLVQNLTEVRHLFLDGIDLFSINPSIFMNLSSSLKSLKLNGCHLQGRFPKDILYRPDLKLLDVGNNENLDLDLQHINRSRSIHLEHLDLSKTSFSSQLSDLIDNLQSLKYLIISNTNISAELPGSIQNLVSLQHLTLHGSNLRGPIPRSLGNLPHLSHLDLSFNQLSGQLPASLTNLTNLEFLDISSNGLEGSIPEEVTAFPALNYLCLSRNLLKGTLPSWLYTASSLKTIYLSENQFSGHIKEFQSKLVEEISLEYNELQGPIPSSIFQLPNLTSLILYSNRLSGVVELDMFPTLQNLQYLSLSYNDGLYLKSINHTLPNLQLLELSSCNVGEFPAFLRGSKSLEHLDLSNNRIHGKIPNWMSAVGKDSLYYFNLSRNFLTQMEQLPWNNIQYLDLSSNLIRGDVPIPSSTTRVFLINNNSLSGEVSSSICNASGLQILDLSLNDLSGMIPQCVFGNLSKSLGFLNLKKNKFHGMIPPTFAKGCRLSNLNLNDNKLEGPLTQSILNCNTLEVLDVGKNNINDTFPHWLGSLPKLQVLVLKSNRLHGSIHGMRFNSSFSKIQIFDISRNFFAGPIPVGYITNFNAMINLSTNGSAMPYMGMNGSSDEFYAYSVVIVLKGKETELMKIFRMWTIIDLSDNKFEGEIPEAIGRLSSLKGLNLSHNNLRGGIPISIGSLSSLEWLDLSSNKLVGEIPRQVGDLTFLSTLNVSKNELVGCIPRSTQLDSFSNSSFEGNEGLRGFQLSTKCSNDVPPPPNMSEDDSESIIDFGWEVVLIGYGCGTIFGMAVGYVVFRTGKPKWIVTLVEGQHNREPKESRISNRNGRRRRRRT